MIAGIDHFVLTVRSLDVTCAFYARALCMTRRDSADEPTALTFGTQKINLHQADRTFEPKARTPIPGGGDFSSSPPRRSTPSPTACPRWASPSSSDPSSDKAPAGR